MSIWPPSPAQEIRLGIFRTPPCSCQKHSEGCGAHGGTCPPRWGLFPGFLGPIQLLAETLPPEEDAPPHPRLDDARTLKITTCKRLSSLKKNQKTKNGAVGNIKCYVLSSALCANT